MKADMVGFVTRRSPRLKSSLLRVAMITAAMALVITFPPLFHRTVIWTEAMTSFNGFEINDIASAGDLTVCAVGYFAADPLVPVIALSEDGGETWLRAEIDVDLGQLASVDFSGGNAGIAVGQILPEETPLVVSTNDGGAIWHSIPTPAGAVACREGIVCSDGATLLLLCSNSAGETACLRSEDGLKWQLEALKFPCSDLLAIDFPSANVGYALCGDPDPDLGPLRRSEDGGHSWRSVSLPDGIAEPSDLAFVDNDYGYVVASAEGAGCLLITNDGGQSWSVGLESEAPLVAVATRCDGSAVILAGTPSSTDPGEDGTGAQVLIVYEGSQIDDCSANGAALGAEAESNCTDGVDNDCDGATDCDDSDCAIDADGDGQSPPPCGNDCNDSRSDVAVGATEICDGVDNDCNGRIDEDDPSLGMPCDGPDGDSCKEGVIACVSGRLRCTDRTGTAIEICDGVDNDCDGQVDEGEDLAGCTIYYLDIDCDGYGDAAVSGRCLCGPEYSTDYTATQWNDCDDWNALVNPGAAEICDGVDNDCDGQVDEGEDLAGCTIYYLDLDCDGYGDAAVSGRCLCGPEYSTGYTATQWNDCDDMNATVCPICTEICDGLDNDCDGQVDEGEDLAGCTIYYRDLDCDGYGDAAVSGRCLCGPEYSTGYTATQWNDCDDMNATVNPGVGTETDCTDGKDNDCDGLTDGDDPDCGS